MRLHKQKLKIETDPLLPSGTWEGFYCYQSESAQHRMEIELQFRESMIDGSGIDDVASFTWKGKYSLEKQRLFMTKTYPTHRVYYSGQIDENGIWGTWKLDSRTYGFPEELTENIFAGLQLMLTGGFHIWPVKQRSASNKAAMEAVIESEHLKKLFALP